MFQSGDRVLSLNTHGCLDATSSSFACFAQDLEDTFTITVLRDDELDWERLLESFSKTPSVQPIEHRPIVLPVLRARDPTGSEPSESSGDIVRVVLSSITHGITLGNWSNDQHQSLDSVFIVHVDPRYDEPAAVNKPHVGDRILQVYHHSVLGASMFDIMALLDRSSIDGAVTLLVQRVGSSAARPFIRVPLQSSSAPLSTLSRNSSSGSVGSILKKQNAQPVKTKKRVSYADLAPEPLRTPLDIDDPRSPQPTLIGRPDDEESCQQIRVRKSTAFSFDHVSEMDVMPQVDSQAAAHQAEQQQPKRKSTEYAIEVPEADEPSSADVSATPQLPRRSFSFVPADDLGYLQPSEVSSIDAVRHHVLIRCRIALRTPTRGPLLQYVHFICALCLSCARRSVRDSARSIAA
jgi:hypothetical protein